MDFHEYWELIPDCEKYESIGQVSFKSKINEFLNKVTFFSRKLLNTKEI